MTGSEGGMCVCVYACVGVRVCVCKRDAEKERQSQRKTDRHTETYWIASSNRKSSQQVGEGTWESQR